MPYSYKIDKERKPVISTAGGVFTKADGLRVGYQLMEDHELIPSFAQLADFRRVTRTDVTGEETGVGCVDVIHLSRRLSRETSRPIAYAKRS